jgi:hypothetical protein
MRRFTVLALGGSLASVAGAVVYPTGAHAAFNFIPFGNNQTCTQHQVFAASLFGASPVNISSIGFAPQANSTYTLDLTMRLGYTNAIPGQFSASGGLQIPVAGGGGGPNNNGPMSLFYQNAAHMFTVSAASSANFSEFVINGTFNYDPNQGNLLVEIVSVAGVNPVDLAVSRAAGSAQSSRAYNSTRFTSMESPTTATRMDFTYTVVPEPGSMIALGLGALALISRRRRNR